MYIESVALENFQCFGPGRTAVGLEDGLTAFIGANGSGKTAVCRAMNKVFGVTAEDREVLPGDFHVPVGTKVTERQVLTVDVVLAFPELDSEDADHGAVPPFFRHMSITAGGEAKCRVVLRAEWDPEGTIGDAVDEQRWVVPTLDERFEWEVCKPLPPSERSRIQMIYLPATRDGARQMTSFLRGRLWRAAKWSGKLEDHVLHAAEELVGGFHSEAPTRAVHEVLTTRWGQLHDAATNTSPSLRPMGSDLVGVLRNTELRFEPGDDGTPRPAADLSDGQRSLLHLALTTAVLDLEHKISTGELADAFEITPGKTPSLTLLAVEEPENSLSPFFLSRIMRQLQDVCAHTRAQAVVASHSAAMLSRVEPDAIRYFRLDPRKATASVRPITLPDKDSDEGKYVREAVRAHPEMYFAKFVVLGEGDSEEIVLPRIAQAAGVDLDPSFVAMVPLGGRHTNHFWRLLADIGLPHATLLDLDDGRTGGGPGRVRDACTRLATYGINPLADFDGVNNAAEINEDTPVSLLASLIVHLRTFGVFFSEPLDLDHSMLMTYWDAYTFLEEGATGPRTTPAPKSVLGNDPPDSLYWDPSNLELMLERQEELRWYRYLFVSRSKPSTHLAAMSRLTEAHLKTPPPVLSELVDFIRDQAGL